MIVDTSAIVAILRDESDAQTFAENIAGARIRRVSAVSYVETAALIDGSRDPIASRRFDDFVREGSLQIENVTAEQAHIARQAYKDFGKGSGHPAQLNFGDCFSYALAKSMNESLLFKGHDFAHTDLTSALESP
ncbi:MAG TPA: type II toxin-antitoxin system VapC family toxin [Candidatus Acidoferrales bacterium]|jgi:ribonuclease VapC